MDKKFDKDCIFSVLKESRLFRGLSDQEIRTLIEGKKVQMERYQKNDILFWSDQLPESIYMLIEGNIAMAKNTPGGNRVLSQSITQKGEITGDILLFMDNAGFWEYAVAMENSDVLRIESSILLKSSETDQVVQNKLLRNLLSNAVNRIERIGSKLRYLSMPSVRGRIAYYLFSIQKTDGTITIDATQENISDYIGIARPSFSRELGRMQRDGIIQVNGRNVKILDRDAFDKLIDL